MRPRVGTQHFGVSPPPGAREAPPGARLRRREGPTRGRDPRFSRSHRLDSADPTVSIRQVPPHLDLVGPTASRFGVYLYVGTASRFGREGVTRIQILNHGGDLAISSLVLPRVTPPTPGHVRPHPGHPDARVRSPPGDREAPPGAGSARREAPGAPEGGGPGATISPT